MARPTPNDSRLGDFEEQTSESLDPQCPECDEEFENYTEVMWHAEDEHGMTYSDILREVWDREGL